MGLFRKLYIAIVIWWLLAIVMSEKTPSSEIRPEAFLVSLIAIIVLFRS